MTTAANIANERTLLRLEEDGRHKAAPILSPLEAGKTVAQAEQRSTLKGHAWNEEQRAATVQILSGANQIVGLQGYAGTAKTSTVLVTVAKSAEAQGYRVTALAPTASAAQVLGDALDSGPIPWRGICWHQDAQPPSLSSGLLMRRRLSPQRTWRSC
nr:AAA family ATPase [Acetobacter thailandicus]